MSSMCSDGAAMLINGKIETKQSLGHCKMCAQNSMVMLSLSTCGNTCGNTQG